MSDPTETPVQMAERHVMEGQARAARQEALIAELDRDGHDHVLPEANEALKEMREFQAQAQEHLNQRTAELTAKKRG